MNIRELDEESRRTGVWPPRRIILRVEHGSSNDVEPEVEAPVSVGLVDLASARRPTVRTAPRTAAPAIPLEALAAGQVAPRPPLSRPPAPGSVMRRNGRIVAPPRPASTAADDDAEFARWLAMPLTTSEPGPDYQEPPVWLPEDRRVRAERRRRRITRSTRAQLFGTAAATTIAAAVCCAALAIGLSQTDTVGGSLGIPSIGLFGTRPAPPVEAVEPAATVSRPAARKAARKAPTRSGGTNRSANARKSSGGSNQVANDSAQGVAPSTQARTPTPTRTVTPPPPPPPAAARTTVARPEASTPARKTPAPKPVPAPPPSSPSGSSTPGLGNDGEPRL